MRRVAAFSLIVLMLLLAAVALAANPKKGGMYVGTKPGTVSKRITLKVSKSGKSAVANLYCAGTHSSSMRNITITKGRFSGVRKTGSVIVWKLKGHFTSQTTATAKAILHSVCDGGAVTLTLKLK